MDTSPFPYQGPLAPEEVTGRDDLLAELADRVTQRRVTALLGPRRFGKTSVLRRLAHELTEVTTVWLDLYGATSTIDVAGRLDRALSEADGLFATEARDAAVAVQLNLGVVRAELARPARDRPDPSTRLSQLLQVLVTTAGRVPALLVIDEFSAIANVPGGAELLRTELQHHYRELGIVFAGSEPSTMRQLFTGREQPFYGQADLVTIEPLTLEAATTLIRDELLAGNRYPGRVPAMIHELARGHPQRTMQLADAAWSATPEGGSATQYWPEALRSVRARCDVTVRMLLDELPVGEQRVLRVIANGGSPFGAAAVQVGLSKGSATHARDQLVAKGHLADGGKELVDPLVADWLRLHLPVP